MQDKVTLTRATAYGLLRFIIDIKDIDKRAKCSDGFFRAHFLDRIKALDAYGATIELQKAIEAADKVAESDTKADDGADSAQKPAEKPVTRTKHKTR